MLEKSHDVPETRGQRNNQKMAAIFTGLGTWMVRWMMPGAILDSGGPQAKSPLRPLPPTPQSTSSPSGEAMLLNLTLLCKASCLPAKTLSV